MLVNTVVLTVYLLLLVCVALRVRGASQFEEFALAKRTLPAGLIFASLAATYVGPGFSIGFAGKGFESGFLFLGLGLAYAVQNIVVGVWIAPRLRAFRGCHTLGDVFGRQYGPVSHLLAGVISTGLCAGLSAVMAGAGVGVVQQIVHVPTWGALLIVVGVTALYTSTGGLRASVATDAFQFVVFALLMPPLLLWIAIGLGGEGIAQFGREAMTLTRTGFQSTSWWEIVGLILAFLLGETLIPPYANRALASRSTRASRDSFLLAGLYSLVWFGMMLALGVMARGVIPSGTRGDEVLMLLVRTRLPGPCYVLLLILLMSIIMSSLDSLLNAGAVALTQDVVRPWVRLSDRQLLVTGRVATVVVAAIAAAVIWVVGPGGVQDIINGLIVCYTIWAPAMLPALVAGLWMPRPRPLAGVLSMVAGGGVSLVFTFGWTPPLPAILPALGAAIVGYWVGHALGREGRP